MADYYGCAGPITTYNVNLVGMPQYDASIFWADGFDTLVFDYAALKKSGIEIPQGYFVDQTPFMDIEFSGSWCGSYYAPLTCSGGVYDFISPWFKEWFLPWYIKIGFQIC